jgi:hypothetical protein
MSFAEKVKFVSEHPAAICFIRRFIGSRELINGGDRWCIWIDDEATDKLPNLTKLLDDLNRSELHVKPAEVIKPEAGYRRLTDSSLRRIRAGLAVAVPKVSSARRNYIPCVLTEDSTIVSDLARVIYDASLWNAALIASRLHLVWIATVCGKLKTDFRYSNTLGWNTFPVPTLTEKNKADLTRCAEDILLAREAHFPATIADLYDPETMPADLREAHERNDEALERIYIGRRFRNDTERLEKLFELYTKMTANQKKARRSPDAQPSRLKAAG